MNLNYFENYIEKKILARGYDYYENNYVTSVEETEENVCERILIKKYQSKWNIALK